MIKFLKSKYFRDKMQNSTKKSEIIVKNDVFSAKSIDKVYLNDM